ncbi:MFS transporter [Mucilaginibacter sp. P25]|uniref:Fucose permease n=1 Tax=Mucilaginibacter gossypii TaxID=551996 RepID=A0A1G7WP65_9SPHI|nr:MULTISPECIES: MFS transporter [Mucilaginibacter]QTE40148.1 MFS transporter [Mucilaginibacter gossypii]RAV50085.1 MFS transporter [Mucilaginibacter rubeus]SDG73716.1 Fucose permease [Mucilaginibacter gossypii]
MNNIPQKTDTINKLTLRIAVGAMFFMAGLSFSSWASRIATVQQNLGLSDAGLGAVLFALPVGLMCSLPFSGWIITKIGSKKLVIAALLVYAAALVSLGLAQNTFQLIICLLCFGFASNSVNIAVNTQAVATEQLYQRPIMAFFHGLWSLAGFTGAGIGTFMIANGIIPFHHFSLMLIVIAIGVAVAARYLKDDQVTDSGPVFVMPDKSLIKLGIIAFCSMICEGAMFDWSVIYFKKVVLAPEALVGIGFTTFMFTMAGGRFVADWFAHKFGLKRTLQVSGSLTATGLLIAVAFPYVYTAMAGFLLVGAGVSSVVPMVYSAAGKSKTMSPGVALAAVSTIGFMGFLVGPPVIGFIAGIATLRASFILIACMGISVVVVSTMAKIDSDNTKEELPNDTTTVDFSPPVPNPQRQG